MQDFRRIDRCERTAQSSPADPLICSANQLASGGTCLSPAKSSSKNYLVGLFPVRADSRSFYLVNGFARESVRSGQDDNHDGRGSQIGWARFVEFPLIAEYGHQVMPGGVLPSWFATRQKRRESVTPS